MTNRIEFLKMILSTIWELEKFSSSIAELGDEILDDRIEFFEKSFGLPLPNDYKLLMKRHNGFTVMGDIVYPISDSGENLALIYKREHTLVKVPQFDYLIPFSPDGGGNFYCFDTRYLTNNGYSFPVVFWVSNYEYTLHDQPEVVYSSFIEFVREVIIEWTLEQYDYEGNEK